MIDLRSDTVSRPSPAMRKLMAEAEVGDDVWGDDPTVARLERSAAELLGKEAAVFVPSGTQSNLCALMAHCQRGDEYIVGENAHTYRYEAGGAAVLGSIQPQPVSTLADGTLDLAHVARVIKPADDHFADSKLLCLENTNDGRPLPLAHQEEAAALAGENRLSLHLDGARIWNAAVAIGVEPRAVAAPFDTVSVCLSKGLGAPVGSVLVGSGDLIERARKWRKMLGGGMRQSGVLAAAGLYAIENNIDRLADDHANAARLAEGLGQLDGVTIEGHATNMVFVRFENDPAAMSAAAADNDILFPTGGPLTRLVTHIDVTADDIETTIDVVAKHLDQGSGPAAGRG
ncbi:MAG: low-specificity L-threonine aldolase [Acidimicrobiales bacterium]